ncbi:phosphoglycerate mutase family protein [Viridothelium virens]|uniref:Phosphoglycerate mutase family protein n=1 Tax=Viridothelium virens TaxID=1048519 RepID=A0A6A6H7T4_VIRVR|nr:phosphoglycerate mutase family protein [Viridothelium virens]
MTDHSSIEYSTINGFFLQSESSTNTAEFDYTNSNFGLIERNYETDEQCPLNSTSWQRFAYYLDDLNRKSPSTVHYRVFFLARHGQGDHNVGEEKYGTAAWDDCWSKLDSADGLSFFDAHLTDLGIQQAKIANKTWMHQLTVEKTPSPEIFYTSPLYRCLQTAETTFKDPELPLQHAFVPRVKELLREQNGIHTCDARSPASTLRAAFPAARFDPDFAETDPLWRSDVRETDAEMVPRLRQALDGIWRGDARSCAWVSVTAHNGAVRAMLRVFGHRAWDLATGGVVVVFVRGEEVGEGSEVVG